VHLKPHIPERIKLFFYKDKELYFSLNKLLGFYPHNISLYKQALLHKSIKQTDKVGHRINNERLEFLGDSILSAVVSDVLYRHFPGKREGFLTVTRSKIVQRETLNKVSAEIGLDKLTKEATNHLSHNNNIYGNAFEALVGAIYLDRGYGACMDFLQKRILQSLMDIDTVASKEVNFKSRLLEWSQKARATIKFETTQPHSEKRSPVFVTVVFIEDIEAGHGQGFSKKESQQKASEESMSLIHNTNFRNKIQSAIENSKREAAIDLQPSDDAKQADSQSDENLSDPKNETEAEMTDSPSDNADNPEV
jgi:ribonuclease-3